MSNKKSQHHYEYHYKMSILVTKRNALSTIVFIYLRKSWFYLNSFCAYLAIKQSRKLTCKIIQLLQLMKRGRGFRFGTFRLSANRLILIYLDEYIDELLLHSELMLVILHIFWINIESKSVRLIILNAPVDRGLEGGGGEGLWYSIKIVVFVFH